MIALDRIPAIVRHNFMSRRKFLSFLGLTAVAALLAPVIPSLSPNPFDDEPIFGWQSYRFRMTVTLPPDRSYRLRFIDTGGVPGNLLSAKSTKSGYRTYVFADKSFQQFMTSESSNG